MEVKLSLITPVHNAEAYLEQCLSSVLNQSLKEIELICIDDASTDNSLHILKTYQEKDPRLKVFCIEKSGQGVARNLGLKEASGEFVGFVDSDDWVEPAMFEQLYQTAKKDDSEVAFCYPNCVDHKTGKKVSSAYFKIERKKLHGPKPHIILDKDEILKLLPFISVVPWNKIYSREILRRSKATFAEKLAHEDLPFYIHIMAKARRITLLRKELYNYRVQRRASSSHQSAPEFFEEIFPILKIADTAVTPTDQKLVKSFSLFKIAYLLTCLNGVFRSKQISAGPRRQFFDRTRKIFQKEAYPKMLSRIERLQYIMVVKNWRTGFHCKVLLDQLKEKLL